MGKLIGLMGVLLLVLVGCEHRGYNYIDPDDVWVSTTSDTVYDFSSVPQRQKPGVVYTIGFRKAGVDCTCVGHTVNHQGLKAYSMICGGAGACSSQTGIHKFMSIVPVPVDDRNRVYEAQICDPANNCETFR